MQGAYSIVRNEHDINLATVTLESGFQSRTSRAMLKLHCYIVEGILFFPDLVAGVGRVSNPFRQVFGL